MRKSQSMELPCLYSDWGTKGLLWAERGPVSSTAHLQKVPCWVKLKHSPLADHHCFLYFGKPHWVGKLLPTRPSCLAAMCSQGHVRGSLPETGFPQSQWQSLSPAASLAGSILPAMTVAVPLQQGQRDMVLPHSHTPRPGGEALSSTQLSATLTQHSHGWKLSWPSYSGLEEISLPQSNPAHAKFPSAALQSPKTHEEEAVSQELKGKARLTVLADDEWEPWKKHTGGALAKHRRLLTLTHCSPYGLLLPQLELLEELATGRRPSMSSLITMDKGTAMMEVKWGKNVLRFSFFAAVLRRAAL